VYNTTGLQLVSNLSNLTVAGLPDQNFRYLQHAKVQRRVCNIEPPERSEKRVRSTIVEGNFTIMNFPSTIVEVRSITVEKLATVVDVRSTIVEGIFTIVNFPSMIVEVRSITVESSPQSWTFAPRLWREFSRS
jgi:hypothetical protein